MVETPTTSDGDQPNNADIEARRQQLAQELADPSIINDLEKLRRIQDDIASLALQNPVRQENIVRQASGSLGRRADSA